MLKAYEWEVIRLLAAGVLSPGQIDVLASEAESVAYEHTDGGYFLTLTHGSLPAERVVCDKPLVTGMADGVGCGFVVFMEGGKLTLECHSWGDVNIPEGFRDGNVEITAA